jgi:predicted membrane protein
MQNTSEKKRIFGYIITICGFILIVITVLNYLFEWKLGVPPAVIGILFLAIGAQIKKI